MSKKIFGREQILMITTIGVLVAIAVLLRSFASIMITPQFRLSFDFLAIALIAIKFGPWKAGTAAMMADLIAFWLFPRGIFFPGFTFTAFLAGSVYGIFMHNRPGNMLYIVISVAIVTIVVQFGIETIWLMIMFDNAFVALLPARLLRTAVMLPLQILCIKFACEGARAAKLL
ncbi:MAG: folate family ECF transporter S component [Defluviitaleaceae bacterium]|nr:folate family ECF transporter S component [Defluviitaleaceae bacterium]